MSNPTDNFLFNISDNEYQWLRKKNKEQQQQQRNKNLPKKGQQQQRNKNLPKKEQQNTTSSKQSLEELYKKIESGDFVLPDRRTKMPAGSVTTTKMPDRKTVKNIQTKIPRNTAKNAKHSSTTKLGQKKIRPFVPSVSNNALSRTLKDSQDKAVLKVCEKLWSQSVNK